MLQIPLENKQLYFSSDWDQSQHKCSYHLHHTLHQTLHAVALLAML